MNINPKRAWLLPSINMTLTVLIIVSNFKILAEPNITAMIIALVFNMCDLTIALNFLIADARGDYRIFSGITGREEKTIVREKLYKATLINSGLATIMLTVLLATLLTKVYTNSIAVSAVLIYTLLFVIAVGFINKKGARQYEER